MSGRDFELRERLGEGRYGIVYRAYERGLDRDVAVKVVRPDLVSRAGFVDVFVDEARLIARVEHPNVVPLYGYGHEEDEAWLMMRLLRGGSLASSLRQGPWRLQAAAQLLIELGGALGAAHRLGLVHRDVKPGNVLAYMAPEQLRGEQATEASDVYSLGLVMFEVISGNRAWASGDVSEVVRSQLNEQIPQLTSVRSDLPAELGGLLRRATAKQQAERPGLEEFVEEFGAALEPPRPRPRTEPIRSGPLLDRLTPVVGRSAEIAEVTEMLGTARLVTLTGVGGVGKTTVAAEVGRVFGDTDADGVYVVELASITDAGTVLDAIASAVGLLISPRDDILDELRKALANHETLLVIDNCEHLVETVAPLVEHLLREVSGLRVLATSRELLGVAGEATFLVGSLETPPEGVTDLDEIAGFSSVQLFSQRAAGVRHAFAVSEENVEAIARICRRLDGIPLAIELAAARTRVLTPQEISERLDDRFGLLSSGPRTAVPRQRTLEAAVDWSYDLLSPEERLLFLRLSVFLDGCTIEALEEVGSGRTISREAVLDLAESLVDKSLVFADETDVGTRYRMLETVRRYAAMRLDMQDDAADWHRRHAAWFRRLAAQGTQIAADSAYWRPRLIADRHNINSALHWLYEREEVSQAATMAVDLWRFWLHTGAAEASTWYERLLDHEGDIEPSVFGAILHGAASLDPDPARGGRRLEAAIEFKRTNGIDATTSLNNLGLLLTQAGELDRAREVFQRAAHDYPESDDLIPVYENLTDVAFQLGELEEARRLIEISAQMAASADRELYSWAGIYLAYLSLAEGDIERARDTIAEYRQHHQLGDGFPSVEQAGNVAAAEATIERVAGDLVTAEERAAIAATEMLSLPYSDRICGAMALWGTISVEGHRMERAARIFGFAFSRSSKPSLPMLRRDNVESFRNQAKNVLGASAYDRLSTEGAAMTAEQAVTYASDDK
jgi:non-specific serine/threonine protein kinase